MYYYWKELGSVASSSFLFDTLENLMIAANVPWPNKQRWKKYLANRWVSGRATSAAVCGHRFVRTASLHAS